MTTRIYTGLPGVVFPTRGNSYTADAQGFINITAPAQADILDLLVNGFTLVPNVVPAGASSTIFGGSALGSNFGTAGSIYKAFGAPFAANAADTTDDILGGIVIPASALDLAGRFIIVTAFGKSGATTNNKRFKIFINGTLAGHTISATGVISGGTVSAGTPVADSGTWVNGTTPNNAVGWMARARLGKYGAAAANTQVAWGETAYGTLNNGAGTPQALTLTESAVITIVVTGSSYTTGAAGDVGLWGLEVNTAN